MADVSAYPEIIKRVIQEYAGFKPSLGEVEVETVFADAQGHYELVYSGWHDFRRIHGVVIHVDIRGDKVWIQHDGTEDGIAGELMEAGIPQERIVLAWHHPHKRPFTGFAVG